jgi:para-aminobenzoate synthetase / 4-amino-4-deoxychorismate lyase
MTSKGNSYSCESKSLRHTGECQYPTDYDKINSSLFFMENTLQETQSIVSAPGLHDADFSLTETILWEHCCGYWLLPEHLARLKSSAAQFSCQLDETRLTQELDKVVTGLGPAPHKVHVLLGQNGDLSVSVEALTETRAPVRAQLAKHPIDVDDAFLYHNTTRRQLYEQAKAEMPGVDEVLLWNSKGEVTESCTSNIVVEIDEKYYTPPITCGLLPGTYRASLLADGGLHERVIAVAQLQDCTKIYLINSLVGWRDVELIP